MGRTSRNRVYLIVELFAVFVALPGLLALRQWLDLMPGLRIPLIPAIWLVAVCCLGWLLRQRDFDRRNFGLGSDDNFRQYLPGVLIRFVILGSILALVVYRFQPDIWLSLPRRYPRLWLLILFAYPILSVYPQGIVWRAFILHRYRSLIPNPIVMLIVAGVLFSFGHIVLLNEVALAITLVGGLMFTRTYQRTGSLLLAGIEHALYGDLAFTLGLGAFLYRHI
ncbi:MAG: CPBP family intramembrane glutamic endopeptidase [Phycisphaeraceae bacterium]